MSLWSARAFLVGVVVLAVAPGAAAALEGPVILGFGASYAAPDGGSSTHRGIDVAAEAGAPVDAPVSGRVRFAGRVPGPGGASVWCVSIESDRGTVTLMPLEGVTVNKGDSIDAGHPIARLAPDGDPSSPEPHVHVGLKAGDVYLDPSSLLATAASATEAEDASPVPHVESQQSAAQLPSGATVVAAPSPESVPQPHSAPGAVAVEGVAPSPVASGVTQPTEVPIAGQPGVSVPIPAAGTQANAASGITLSLPTHMPVVATSGISNTPAAAGGTGGAAFAWKSVSAPALAVLGAAVAASVMIVTRKALVRRSTSAGPVSDRLGILLQHLKAGDTLCGLTSCSGPLPSQSRGH